jgi:hypothetical protein
MPAYTYNFINRRGEYVYDSSYVLVEWAECRLVRRDAAGNYALDGLFYESTVELPGWGGDAITEFTSVDWNFSLPEGTSVTFQLSTDGGTAWQYYDGAAWQPSAGPSDWMSYDNLGNGLPSITGKRMKLKMKLTPNEDGTRTPLVRFLEVYYEGVWNYFEDLKRSLKRYIDENLYVDLAWGKKIVSPTTSFTLDTDWEVISVSAVYDLTNDPYKITNLFSAYDSSTKIVTLTGAVQTAELETNYTGKCPVFLSADDNLTLSELPAIVVQLPLAREDRYRPKNLFSYEYMVSTDTYRRRERPIPTGSSVILRGLAATEVESLSVLDGLAELFQGEGIFLSLATGLQFFILTFDPLRDNDSIATGLYDKAVQMQVFGEQELAGYTEIPAAADIELSVGGAEALTEEERGTTITVETSGIGDTFPVERSNIS